MSAKTEILMTLEAVIDHDCGNYTVGEIDFGIRCGNLEAYLKEYGTRGKDEIVNKLGFLIHYVHREWERIPPKAFRLNEGDVQAPSMPTEKKP